MAAMPMSASWTKITGESVEIGDSKGSVCRLSFQTLSSCHRIKILWPRFPIMTDYKWSDYKLWICSFLPALSAKILCIIENTLLNAIYLSCLGFSLEVGLIHQIFNRYHNGSYSPSNLPKSRVLQFL